MGSGDPTRDPREQLREASEQVRAALANARERVVQLVMRRNFLQDEATKLERLVTDLETKAALAERVKNTSLAEEIRQERKSREAELERLRGLLAQAEAEAESAKIGLPEEEAKLAQQLQDLNTQFVARVGDHIEATAGGGPLSEPGALMERAGDKIRGMEREASARAEVARGTPGSAYRPRFVSPEQSAEEMLTQLEARLGLDTQGSDAPAATGHFLELDAAPAPAAPLAPPVPKEVAAAPQQAAAPSKVSEASETRAQASAPPRQQAPTILTTSKGDTSRMEPTQRIRVAGVGTGNIFRGAHLPTYPEIPQLQLVALCDPDKTAQDLAFKRYQSLVEAKIKQASERDDMATIERLERDLETVQICDDISEVIETVKPDLVDICTQPFLHAPLSIQALEAGINVMCEKPMARTWLETQKVIETAKRTGKTYQHNENWLWDKDYYTAKKLVDTGAIGEPILMFLAQAHGGPEGSPKFWNPDFGGGGALLDNGIHAIGAAWYVCGLEKRPTVVKAAAPFGMSIRMPHRIIDGRYQKITVDDDAHILIRFEDMDTGAWATAHVEGSWSERDSPETAIIGTTGKILFRDEDNGRYAVVYDSHEKEIRRLRVSGPTWQPWPSSFYGEILNMVECLRNGVPTISGPEFGADNSAIVGASYLSEMNGKRASSVKEFEAFARGIAERYPNDPKAADDALVDALLSAVRNKK
jgi:predicted dehydrogenase/phage shock protein A